jgi:phage-related protein
LLLDENSAFRSKVLASVLTDESKADKTASTAGRASSGFIVNASEAEYTTSQSSGMPRRAFTDERMTTNVSVLIHSVCEASLVSPQSAGRQSVAPGVAELRLHSEDGQFRMFYLTARADRILVFHAFAKKTRETPALGIALGRRRLKELPHEKD